MAFWNDVANNIGQAAANVGHAFGIGNAPKKRKPQPGDPDYVAPTPAVKVPTVAKPTTIKTQQPASPFDGGITALTVPGSKPAAAPVVKPTTTQTLDSMTQANLPAAKQQVQQGEGVIGHISNFFTHDDDKIAQQNARTKAITQFQEKNGYDENPDVSKYGATTSQMATNTSKGIKTQNDNISNVIKKSSEIPVVSDFTAMGSAGANLAYNAFGNKEMANDAHDNFTKATLGMSDADVSKLPQAQQDRLRKLQTGLAVASPVMGALDVASLGSAGAALSGLKSAAVNGGKEAIIQGAKDAFTIGAKNTAARTARQVGQTEARTAAEQEVTNAIKNTGKNALVGGISAPIVAAPVQNYINNGNPLNFTGFDPSQIPREAGTAALWSALLPGASKKPEVEDINNARTAVVREALSKARDIKEIPVTDTTPGDVPIPVSVPQPQRIEDVSGYDVPAGATPPGAEPTPSTPTVQPTPTPIREVGGDTPGVNKVSVPTPEQVAAQQFKSQPKSNPDQSVSGMIADPSRVITKADKADAQATIDSALQTGKITDEQHQDLTQQLSTIIAQDEPAAKGRKINVKQVNGIPVTDKTGEPAEISNIRELSRVAKNSLENDTTGIKPNGVDRSGAAVENATARPVEYRRLPDGSVTIVDGRHTLEYARQNGITDFPTKDVTNDYHADPAPSNTPTNANTPVQMPASTQNILDHPKQFNKRQVAAARNQRKLARQLAKTKEGTAEAVDRIDTVSPDKQSGEGFVPTGEFGKSVNGGSYQKVNRASEMRQAVQETANMSPGDVIKTARDNASQNGGGFNRRDVRNIAAMFEQKRIPRGTPEFNEAKQILKEDGTNWGQTGALRNYTIRRNASSDELTSRFESKIYRLANDPSKIDSKLFDAVDAAESKFADTRDAAMQAYNRFTEAPTKSNTKAYHAAQDAADAADKEARTTEYKVASAALKGNKDIKQVRELEKMAQGADMYQMDSVDASMLGGTGTFVRNLTNAAIGSTEEKLFGKLGARIASNTPNARKNDIAVGGGTGVRGLGKNVGNIVDASKARAQEAGLNPLEHLKNWATTGNQLGDALIDTQVDHNVGDHYTQLLKQQGYKGQELKNRASVMARQDPDNVVGTYQTAARVAAGLGSGVTRNNKIETTVKNIISDGLSGGNPNKVTETAAKLVTRMTLGFPTAIGRSAIEGAKRFTLGAPTFIRAMATKDPQARALLVKEAVKQAGTGGAVIAPAFYALGASGAITGAYPAGSSADQKAEQAQWEREGITENSIKIGDSYYQLPSYLGSWAVPALFYASLGRNGGDWGAAAADTAKIVPSLLPTDQMSNLTDVINGRSDFGKFMSQTGASAVRALTPGGALLNQIAKSFDPTQNDTNSGDAWQNLLSKVENGIPFVANGLLDKKDDQGNTLKNPNPVALALGASSTTQDKGVQTTNDINSQTNTTLDSIKTTGALADPNLKAVITDDATKKIYDAITAGKQVTPDDLKKVQDALVKGVSATDDTAYLEKEQYDTNLSALNLKKQIMQADPTTKPSDLDKINTQIARGQVYKDNNVSYDMIKDYESTDLSDWRAMGDSTSDSYDPAQYQALWTLDRQLTAAGGSYKKGDSTKQKFSAKDTSGATGKAAGVNTDFGTLKAGSGAPTVQAYDTIDAQSGSVPIISVVRPNIVHKIGSSS